MTARTASASPAGTTEERAADRPAFLAVVVFAVVVVVALPVLLYLGRDRWFRYDEWDFLASGDATSLHDLFEPHSVHWSTLPVLEYRASGRSSACTVTCRTRYS